MPGTPEIAEEKSPETPAPTRVKTEVPKELIYKLAHFYLRDKECFSILKPGYYTYPGMAKPILLRAHALKLKSGIYFYNPDRPLGNGSYGIVYQSTGFFVIGSEAFTKQCALKLSIPHKDERKRQVGLLNFKKEIRIGRILGTVIDSGLSPSTQSAAITMPLVDMDLFTYFEKIETMTLDLPFKIKIALQIVKKIVDLHLESHLAHHDLKPENIGVVLGESALDIKIIVLLDFGSATNADYNHPEGRLFGTNDYLPFESKYIEAKFLDTLATKRVLGFPRVYTNYKNQKVAFCDGLSSSETKGSGLPDDVIKESRQAPPCLFSEEDLKILPELLSQILDTSSGKAEKQPLQNVESALILLKHHLLTPKNFETVCSYEADFRKLYYSIDQHPYLEFILSESLKGGAVFDFFLSFLETSESIDTLDFAKLQANKSKLPEIAAAFHTKVNAREIPTIKSAITFINGYFDEAKVARTIEPKPTLNPDLPFKENLDSVRPKTTEKHHKTAFAESKDSPISTPERLPLGDYNRVP